MRPPIVDPIIGTTYHPAYEPILSEKGLRLMAAIGELESAVSGKHRENIIYWSNVVARFSGEIVSDSLQQVAIEMQCERGTSESYFASQAT